MVRKSQPREPGPYARAHMGRGSAEPAKKRARKPKPKPEAAEPADGE